MKAKTQREGVRNLTKLVRETSHLPFEEQVQCITIDFAQNIDCPHVGSAQLGDTY